MKKRSSRNLLKLTLAGVAVIAVASTPLLGSAAGLANSPFAVKALNTDGSGKFAIKPFVKGNAGTGNGSTTPTTPPGSGSTTPPATTPTPDPEPTRAPDSSPDLISMKIDTSLSSCTASSTGGFTFNVPSYSSTDPARTPLTAAATINWGDGSAASSAKLGANNHVYKAGKYEIQIVGKLGGITDSVASSSSCISDVTHLGENTGLITLEGFLSGAANVTSVAAPPTSLQNANRMFTNASKFTGIGVENWVLPNLKTASSMFNTTAVFNGDLSKLNPKSLTDATNMFRNSYAFEGRGLSNWKTDSLTNIKGIFESAKLFTGTGSSSVASWNVSKVTDFSRSFYGAVVFTGDLSSWSTGASTTFEYMFNNASVFDSDISGWNVAKATKFGSMFTNAAAFNQPIGKWTTTNMRDLTATFNNAASFNQDLSNWNTSKVTDLTNTFAGAKAFNGNVSSWDTGLVTSMAGTFSRASVFTGELKGWNLTSTTSTSNMFQDATSFNSDISNWSVNGVTSMGGMFWGAKSFNQPLSTWNSKLTKVFSMSNMFNGATSFRQNISGWNVASVTSYDFFGYASGMAKSQVPTKFQSTVS